MREGNSVQFEGRNGRADLPWQVTTPQLRGGEQVKIASTSQQMLTVKIWAEMEGQAEQFVGVVVVATHHFSPTVLSPFGQPTYHALTMLSLFGQCTRRVYSPRVLFPWVPHLPSLSDISWLVGNGEAISVDQFLGGGNWDRAKMGVFPAPVQTSASASS